MLHADGSYHGIRSGTVYPAGEYNHSPVYLARVVKMLDANETGMIYRDEKDHADLIGFTLEVEKAHYYGSALIWRSLRERAYLHEFEIELVSDSPIR